MACVILGISAFFHDAAAALVRDGDIVAAAQEERFTRKKADSSFPRHAVAYCLREAGIGPKDIDIAVFYENPLVKFERLVDTFATFAPEGEIPFRRAMRLWASERIDIPGVIRSELGEDFRGEIRCVGHHESHGASAFYPSPFNEAAILTLDAVGEWATASIGTGCGHRLEIAWETRFPNSLGMLYSAFTYYTGFKVNSGEYKVMGLAPYGTPRYADLILREIAELRDDGSLWLDMSYFNYCQGLTMTSEKFHDLFGGPPRKPETFLTRKEMDLAASVQRVCEEVVLSAGRHAHRRTGHSRLAMAGGVALNCVANGRLQREGPFEEIWVQPAAGDAGGALGAALLVWHNDMARPRAPARPDGQHGSFLGPSYPADAIACFLDSAGAVYRLVPGEADLLDEVAGRIEAGQVVGWFHGRMEFGPRALGHRSILGDARSPGMQQKMNLKIKYRESFRPFAPCVIEEKAHEVFEMRPGQSSPYMLFVSPVREALRTPLDDGMRARMQDPDLRIAVSVPRSTIPAVTHVDYSARVQTVDEARHGRFYRLMKRFEERTGCPVIVNTSFNIRGEPIVCSPEDAYRCFMATEMDCLVIEDCVLEKNAQPSGAAADIEAYKAKYELD